MSNVSKVSNVSDLGSGQGVGTGRSERGGNRSNHPTGQPARAPTLVPGPGGGGVKDVSRHLDPERKPRSTFGYQRAGLGMTEGGGTAV